MRCDMAYKGISTLTAQNLSEFMDIFTKYPQPGFYARGEPREYKKPFLPCIWRNDHTYQDRTPVNSNTSFTKGELEALKKCQNDVLNGTLKDDYFTKFFDQPTIPIDLQNNDLFHWAALAQHYNKDQRYPTRLLDITKDPLAALYFATEKNPEHNGFVFYFQSNFNDISSQELKIKYGGTFFDVLEIETVDRKYHPKEDTLNLAKPPFPNKRIEAQRGSFIWTRGIDSNYLKGSLIIEVPAKAKPQILEELERVNCTRATLFPK